MYFDINQSLEKFYLITILNYFDINDILEYLIVQYLKIKDLQKNIV